MEELQEIYRQVQQLVSDVQKKFQQQRIKLEEQSLVIQRIESYNEQLDRKLECTQQENTKLEEICNKQNGIILRVDSIIQEKTVLRKKLESCQNELTKLKKESMCDREVMIQSTVAHNIEQENLLLRQRTEQLEKTIDQLMGKLKNYEELQRESKGFNM